MLQASKNNATINGFVVEEITAVNLPPVAIINSSAVEGSAPFEITFNGSSSTGTGDLIYNWNFGDGGSSELADPEYLFQEAGTYNVV
ncbi:PKD domain-containing protein, partial [uncultured Cyclobacterium sp.]|uniref:PKD domain-containing protein n=1 Tax=uncultured Cyclobacterium sp. TaxID=453820 RepID=UPI0030EC2133